MVPATCTGCPHLSIQGRQASCGVLAAFDYDCAVRARMQAHHAKPFDERVEAARVEIAYRLQGQPSLYAPTLKEIGLRHDLPPARLRLIYDQARKRRG